MALIEWGTKAMRYAQGWQGLRLEDVLLTSFPRSGSTWLRFILCNAANQIVHGRIEPVNFHEVDREMVEFGVDDLRQEWNHAPMPRVVKTHCRYLPIFQGRRAVLLVRNPREVMISFYCLEAARQRQRFQGTFQEFIRNRRFGLPAWFRHIKSWQARPGVFLLRYEDLKADTAQEVKRLFAFVDLDVSEDVLSAAVENSSFQKMREVEERRGLSNSKRFKANTRVVRSSGEEDTSRYFCDDDETYLAEMFVQSKLRGCIDG